MKKLLAIILALGMIFLLCACGGDNNGPTGNDPVDNQVTDTSSKEESVSKFTVTVVDQNGDPVSSVALQVCQDELCMANITDANGVAQFNIEATDGHTISLNSCPEGYETDYVGDNKLELEDDLTEFTFEITKK